MNQLQWLAKKSAYEYINGDPDIDREERIRIEEWIYKMLLVYGVQVKEDKPHYVNNVFKGAW